MSALITAPGAYPDIDNTDYHRNPNLLPEPSLSSSGAKTILDRSLYHFWANSPMNPARPPESEDSSALRIGKAAHDAILLGERWDSHYFILPEGFNAAHTSRFASTIAERDVCIRRGMTVLTHGEHKTVIDVVDAIGAREGAPEALSAGVPEMTLAWQDKDTGVWLRARPDWLPNSIINDCAGLPRIVSDLKFMDARHCHPDGWSRAVGGFGYHISAAFYDMGIEAIYGRGADAHIFLPVEKTYPHYVSIYQLPAADLARGKAQCRIAIRRFADALAKGQGVENWPGYTLDVEQVGLTNEYRRVIDEHGSRGDAAFINAVEGE